MASSDTPAGPDAGAPEPPPDGAHGLRALVRASEVGFVLLASLIGVFAGLCVLAMGWTTQTLHELIFRIPAGQHLSATPDIAPALTLLGPALGGLAFGIASWLIFRKRSQPVDPIEANALHGGRMSLTDSLIVAVQTAVSSGVGASVGLEAGYTQVASGFASRIGMLFHLRRADLRLLVGCAAGGAIGAAFDAPLTGAFYAFELILGSYSIAAFVPVMAATFTATVTRRMLDPSLMAADPPVVTGVGAADLPSLILLGIFCGLAGIAVMRGATLIEAGFRRSEVPVFLRPADWRPRGRRAGAVLAGGVLRRPWRRAHVPRRSSRACRRSPCSCSPRRSPPRSRSAPAFAAACSSPRCCSACWPGGCSPAASPSCRGATPPTPRSMRWSA